MGRFTDAASAATLCAFPLLVHLGAAHAEPLWTAAALALVVSSAISPRLNIVSTVVVALCLAALVVAIGQIAPDAIVHAPPVLLNLLLCALFGATLRAGREPLISTFSRLERGGELPPDLIRYTRALTWIWVGFFVLMAAVSLALAAWGTTTAWSFFTNVLNYVLVGVFFLCEYGYRRTRYRQYEHARPLTLVRQIRAHGFGLGSKGV